MSDVISERAKTSTTKSASALMANVEKATTPIGPTRGRKSVGWGADASCIVSHWPNGTANNATRKCQAIQRKAGSGYDRYAVTKNAIRRIHHAISKIGLRV